MRFFGTYNTSVDWSKPVFSTTPSDHTGVSTMPSSSQNSSLVSNETETENTSTPDYMDMTKPIPQIVKKSSPYIIPSIAIVGILLYLQLKKD